MRLPRRIAGGLAALSMVGLAALAARAGDTVAPGDRGATAPGRTAVEAPAECGSLQARIDETPPAGVLDLTGCNFTLAAPAVVRRPLTIRGGTIAATGGGFRILGPNVTIGGTLIHVGPDSRGIVVAANDVTLDGVTVTGPQARRYSYREAGIFVYATAVAPVRRLAIRNVELADFGGYGAYLRHVAGLDVERARVHDVVHAGILLLSVRDATIERNVVERIGVEGSQANDGNAYGIAVSRGSGDLAEDPLSSDVTVDGNTVEDVPTWNGLDTHAGRRISFTNNTVRGAARAVFVTTDDEDNRPSEVTILGNVLAAPTTAGGETAAVSLYAADDVAVRRNVARGWPTFFRDIDELSRRVVVEDNTVSP